MGTTSQQNPQGAGILTLPKPGRPLLGQLLLASGAVTAEDLREALCRQQESRQLLGEILVQMGAVTAEQVAAALEAQQRLERAG